MAAKAGNVAVRNDGDNGKRGQMPLASSYSPMAGVRSELDRMFSRFYPEGWPHMGMGSLMGFDPLRGEGGMNLGTVLQSAKTDISETDSEYKVSVELPGIDEKEIEVEVSEGVLTLNAEKREEREEKKKSYHLSERSYGCVRRSFRVPDGVDVGMIKADFSKGVLQVTLPKTKEAKAKQRKIPVRAS